MRVVEKVGAIVDLLATEPDWGVRELAREIDTDKAMVHRILKTLLKLEWTRQIPETKRYARGPALERLQGNDVPLFELIGLADPIIARLAQTLDETVYLSGRHANHNVIAIVCEGTKEVRAVARTGRRTPMHCGAAGKILMAFEPPPVRKKLLEGPFKRYTSRTITDAVELGAELDAVRERGWAFESEEYAYGVSGVAVPVLSERGHLLAAICVRAPAARLGPAQAETLIPMLLGAAEELSSELASAL